MTNKKEINASPNNEISFLLLRAIKDVVFITCSLSLSYGMMPYDG